MFNFLITFKILFPVNITDVLKAWKTEEDETITRIPQNEVSMLKLTFCVNAPIPLFDSKTIVTGWS